MILKSLVVLCGFFYLNAECRDYTYDPLAGGWLKLHKPASWDDASIRCDSEGGVLAAPVNSQIRNAIRAYVARQGMPGATILTGIQADYNTGDYYSVEGVPLVKMPVLVESNPSVDYQKSDSCVNWMTSKDEVAVSKCSDENPFVCFKKRKTVVVAGCGTRDEEYSYDERSGSCYKFHRKGLSWFKAYAKCKQEGGYLAVINSQLEHRVLLDVFAKHPNNTLGSEPDSDLPDYVSIGFRDWLDGESWKTRNDQTLEEAGFNTWAAGEPNNGHGNENCGTLYRPGFLNDANCDLARAFICEKNPEILYT